MDSLGYESTYLIYGAGVVVERQTQLVQRDGELYRVLDALDIPLTLTGDWGADAPKLQAVGDMALRQALADAQDPTKGAYMNGIRGRTVGSRLDDSVSVKDDHGAAGGGAKGDGIADDTAAIMAAWTAATISGKTLIFPQGKYNHTGLNLAFAYLHIHAIGRVELHNTAPGLALKLDQGVTGNMRGLVFDGDFVITGNSLSTDGLFIRPIHDSHIKANVRDVPGTAFVINYGVLTKYDLRCSIEDGSFNIAPSKGVLIDRRAVGQYVADYDLHLVIEGIPRVGVHNVECVGSRFSGGSEYNTKGYQDSASCRDNTFSSFWCEGNTSGFDFEINSERPVFINCKGTGGTNAHAYSAQSGYYHDIGDRRFYDILINIQTKDSGMTGPVSISGIPGVSRNDANRISVAGVGNYTSIATTTARPELSGRILPNTNAIQLFLSDPNIAAIALDSSALVSGSSLILSGQLSKAVDHIGSDVGVLHGGMPAGGACPKGWPPPTFVASCQARAARWRGVRQALGCV